jgi:hypothetical protein
VATFVDFIDFIKRLIKDAKQKLFLIVANLRVHHPSFGTSSRAVQEGPELGAKVGSHSKRFDTLCAKTRQNPQLLAPDGTIA